MNGRKKDDAKRKRLCEHQTGPDCKCGRFKCFQVEEVAQRTSWISLFKGKQTAPLAGVELKQQQTIKENGYNLILNERDDSAQTKGEDDWYFGK